MTIEDFPDVEQADENGLLAVGGELNVKSLLLAYRSGIFPWPHWDYLLWFSPPQRAVLAFTDFKVSRSLTKLYKKQLFEFRRNYNFESIISHCADPNTPGRDSGTWITSELKSSYLALHQQGYADSFEVYQNDQLVGGLYGVRIGKYFSAESMFYRVANASKLALYYCIQCLQNEGFTWLDCQVMSAHLHSLGAKNINRNDFQKMLKKALK